jgi:hypothetical protein
MIGGMDKNSGKKMPLATAMRLLKCKREADLARALGTNYQNVQYWRVNGLPKWWAQIVRGMVA